jgi:ketosteroid isomerase-like protein
MIANQELIKRFYAAFQNLDAETMAACYHTNIQFHDPVFKTLHGKDAGDMWRMLVQRGGKNLEITFSNIIADENHGTALWEAKYPFSKTNRNVHNKIKATFQFQDGKIILHHDHFNFWKWSRMALGVPGIFLGWSSILNKKVSTESLKALKNFQKKISE